MKFLKKLAILCTALTLCVGFASFTACGGNNNSAGSSVSEETKYSPDDVITAPTDKAGYYFKVINADGTPAKNVKVQLCKGSEMCFDPIAVDANGDVCYVPNAGVGEYDIHVLGGEWGTDEMSFTGAEKTPATYPANYIILVLK
jgi:hypothetical protein